MKTNAQFVFAALCLAGLINLPIDTFAGRQATPQRAGEITRLIPAVTITRGTSSLSAAEKTAVDWQDILNTQSGGRARVALDDGSLLNVGSESVVQVVKHDAGAQQTALELVSGKMRVQAKKLNLPGAKFEVKTPSGIAGVVGTDVYIGYDDNQMTVVVFECHVKVCNLAGICVEVATGQMTTVRSGDSSGPSQPSPALVSLVSEASAATSLELGNPPLGMVAKSASARVGNNAANDGETVFSGDLVSTLDGGSLLVRIGSLSLQLESNSSAYVFRTPYGAIVELLKGSAVYERPDGPQNIVIVASDVRVTPALSSPGMGQVRMDDPCKISVTVQRGGASVRVGTEAKEIAAGKSYRISPEYEVSVQEARSPEADDYHSSHSHRPCTAGSQTARGHAPVAAGQSKFLYVATGTVIVLTVIPVLEAFESPKRP